MTKRAPLEARDVERGLRAHGFVEQPKTGTSHVKWIKYIGDKKLVVTVDAHHAPYSQDLIRSMANQSHMSANQFYEMCSKDGVKQAKKGKFQWLFGSPSNQD